MSRKDEIKSAYKNLGKVYKGDVGSFSYEDATFDAVVSLNGFHAFPDKEAAYRETFRVLKPGGIFCGCLGCIRKRT